MCQELNPGGRKSRCKQQRTETDGHGELDGEIFRDVQGRFCAAHENAL